MQAPDTPQQHVPEPESRKLPRGADQFSLGLGEDSSLERAKLIAAAVTVVVLVGMFVTSLSEAQSSAWSVTLMILPVGLVVAISARLLRHRSGRRR